MVKDDKEEVCACAARIFGVAIGAITAKEGESTVAAMNQDKEMELQLQVQSPGEVVKSESGDCQKDGRRRPADDGNEENSWLKHFQRANF
ncbi:unnamed protein product [Linum trigynum]|uniref:Uncharacterized protein n=1 Tax=Linum trigynum TaxID=586398 RepID=A0AAV2END3_9ROSI